MGRSTTFYDQQLRSGRWDPADHGQFVANTVFVGMHFAEGEPKQVFDAIKLACEGLGLAARRVDDSVGSGFVHIEIKDAIEAAEFCIFDLTNERPNVYYELGYTHGVGNESNDILLIAKQGTTLHFDVAPLRVNYYRDAASLADIVRDGLQRMIAATRR
jgi:hypothetical protein